jgi:putative tryptophan/tyrosine transport system substrate-binding protein
MAIDIARRNLYPRAVAGWPLAARAQPTEGMRRIDVLMNISADDPEARMRIAGLLQALQELGWTEGSNVRIDSRFASDDADHNRSGAAELVTLARHVIVASGSPSVAALQKLTRSVPIIARRVVFFL